MPTFGVRIGTAQRFRIRRLRNGHTKEHRHAVRYKENRTEDGRIDQVGTSNLQIQKNNADRPSTVATLLVWNQYFYDLPGAGEENRVREFTRVIRQGLNESLRTWVMTSEAGPRGRRAAQVEIFEVVGEFSSLRQEFVSPQKPVR